MKRTRRTVRGEAGAEENAAAGDPARVDRRRTGKPGQQRVVTMLNCVPMLGAVSPGDFSMAFWVGVGIVVVAALWGLWDVTHLSGARLGAIAKVVFTEGWRRGVWLIPALAMIGVIIASQLQKPIDEADAIRQTTKFCLFATGLVVVVTVMILACTNLPREIDNRVIYTVVTKPATRLEIVAGKIWGFSLVAGLILLLMGVFSYGYLAIRASVMRQDIAARLEAGAVDAISRPALEHYREHGLLSAKRLAEPARFQIFADVPKGGDAVRWVYGGGDSEAFAGFDVTNEALTPANVPDAKPAGNGVVVRIAVAVKRNPAKAKAADPQPATTQATTQQVAASQPFISPFLEDEKQPESPVAPDGTMRAGLMVNIYDRGRNVLVDNAHVNLGKPIYLPVTGGEEVHEIFVPVAAEYAQRLVGQPRVYVAVVGNSDEWMYGFGPDPIGLLVPGAADRPAAPGEPPRVALTPIPPMTKEGSTEPAPVVFQGRQGTWGQQLRGDEKAAPVAVYEFRDVSASATGGRVPVEMRIGIERSSTDNVTADASTKVELKVANPDTGAVSEPTVVYPENGRISYFTVPAELMQNGKFDVHVRLLTNEQWVGLRTSSLLLVGGQEPFFWNLLKSLGVLWLMAILVIVIAVFCSTFLSWPIAVVLTVVILLGHWGVQQLGDATAPGIGNVVVTDIFGNNVRNPAAAKAVSSSVEALSSLLRFVSGVLPDISRYVASEDLERGMVVPMSRLVDAGAVTLGFGLPLLGLAYIFMRNKEVAP